MRYTVSMKEAHLFRRMYAKGKSMISPCLAVYVRPNHLAHTRLGFTVSTKVGKAVAGTRSAAACGRRTGSTRGR